MPTPLVPDTYTTAERRVIKELADMEMTCQPTTLTIGPFSAFVLISALQIAVRQPYVSTQQGDLLRTMAGQIRKSFCGDAAAIVDSGWVA